MCRPAHVEQEHAGEDEALHVPAIGEGADGAGIEKDFLQARRRGVEVGGEQEGGHERQADGGEGEGEGHVQPDEHDG